MGFVCPVTLEAKKILQKLWKLNLGWDDEIPEDLQNHWNKWKSELSALSQIQIPRCHLVHAQCVTYLFICSQMLLKMAMACVPTLDLFTPVEL